MTTPSLPSFDLFLPLYLTQPGFQSTYIMTVARLSFLEISGSGMIVPFFPRRWPAAASPRQPFIATSTDRVRSPQSTPTFAQSLSLTFRRTLSLPTLCSFAHIFQRVVSFLPTVPAQPPSSNGTDYTHAGTVTERHDLHSVTSQPRSYRR